MKMQRKIILAGRGTDLQSLTGLLKDPRFVVQVCEDGAKALELALTLRPQLMVVDCDVDILPAEKLSQILCNNPRTKGMSFFFVGREGQEIAGFRRHRDAFFPRPVNIEQLAGHIQSFFARQERTVEVGHQEKQIEGQLKQISLVDLLQVFGFNRKDGILTLVHEKEQGEIFLLAGCVINARLGRIEGEKAFFRLLRWEEGRFWFTPGGTETEVRISSPMDHLVMEGLRQLDEMAAQAGSLPNVEDHLLLKIPRDHLPRGLRPATQEILILLDYYPRVQDILDHSPRPDLEVLQILKILIERGFLEVDRRHHQKESHLPLLTSEEIVAIKDHLGDGQTLLEDATAKILLLASGPQRVRDFVGTLRGISEFEPESAFLVDQPRLWLGDIGRLNVSDSFSLRLFSLPATSENAPLWRPFCRKLFGVILLDHQDAELQEARRFFAEEGRSAVAEVHLDMAARQGFRLTDGDRNGLGAILKYFMLNFLGR